MRKLVCAVVLMLASNLVLAADGVELHAHLFMKEGMTWFFRGDFFGPLKARTFRDRFSSQANPETLARSGLEVVVVSLYAHPLMTMSLRDSVRRQIGLAHEFTREHPEWVIAKTPAEAVKARESGKRVLVFALEGAAGILESEDDLKEFVDREGVRIVTLLHLTDDEFGGVALLKGVLGLSSPLAFFRSLYAGTRDAEGNRVNDRGLTDAGRAMARALIAHKAWIDLAHSSDASQRELVPMLRAAGQPLLYTHTTLRRYLGAERGITVEQLKAVKESGGMVGLMPAEDMLEGTPGAALSGCHDSEGGVPALVAQLRETRAIVGEDAVTLGSDYNGGVRHLHPTCDSNLSIDAEEGFFNIGQAGELEEALGLQGRKVADRFLKTWSRLWSTAANESPARSADSRQVPHQVPNQVPNQVQ